MTAGVIVAAGQGTRMGPGVDKLFLQLAGRPVVAHTWQALEETSEIDQIVVVARAGIEATFRSLAARCGFRKPYRVVLGGQARQDSVWEGLGALAPGVEVVVIQDGARPCTAPGVISATIAAARQFGASVAAQRVTDTIKASDDGVTVSQHLDRSRLWAVQTPQAFRVEILRRALSEVRRLGLSVTDDTAACEWIGQSVCLVESRAPNPKVTTPEDLPIIAAWLAARSASSALARPGGRG